VAVPDDFEYTINQGSSTITVSKYNAGWIELKKDIYDEHIYIKFEKIDELITTLQYIKFLEGRADEPDS